MKSISLSFRIHQPFQLKKFRFFDIGNDSYYYDDFENERHTTNNAENLYLPLNEILIELLNKHKGHFKFALSVSGTAIDQFLLYAPEVLDGFKTMSEIGGIEFLGETYSHSFASLFSENEFKRQSISHSEKIQELFNRTPSVYKNTGLIYTDKIGELISKMGFKSILTDGAQLYPNTLTPDLKIIPYDNCFNEDLLFSYSDRTKSEIIFKLNSVPKKKNLTRLFFDLTQLTKSQSKSLFNFLKSFSSAVLKESNYKFINPGEISDFHSQVYGMDIHPGVEKELNLSAWLGNELQEEAVRKLYSLNDKIENCRNSDLLKDWRYLQSSDHLYYMSSRFFSNPVNSLNPYNSPYEAFMNYMNILDDFIMRLDQASKTNLRRFIYGKSRELVKD